MQQVKASLNYIRIAPRKMRLLADMIRDKKIEQALSLLDFAVKKGALPLKKLIQSAVSNAKNNFDLDEATLRIAKITVDEGPMLKRWRARARGRAARIQKKTSHIFVMLEGEKAKTGRKELKTEKKKPVSSEIRKSEEKTKEEGIVLPKKEAGRSLDEKEKSAKESLLQGAEIKKRRPQKSFGLAKQDKKAWRNVFRRKSF